MKKLIRVLIERLVQRGMELTSIPAYIRDLGNVIAAHGYAGVQDLNNRLRLLGWNDVDLDDRTLELIIAVFELDFNYRPPHWFDDAVDPEYAHDQEGTARLSAKVS